MPKEFLDAIRKSFPPDTWPKIVQAANSGIILADALIADNPFLNWPVGRDQRGDLRRVGVMFSLREACNSGDLPFLCKVRRNTVRNCRHIELHSNNMYLHVTQVGGQRQFPKDTPLRNKGRRSNQFLLFADNAQPEFSSRWYGWLTFGASNDGGLEFICIGLPTESGQQWLDRINLTAEITKQGSKATMEKASEPLLKLKHKFEKEVKSKSGLDS
ncbi:MAG: hypothetical protein K9K66_10445 [Desulfarculaceae bacterium]|nr:hypothetical protein [Desulfarculaceae bacterium]MCF8073915.1 hypothetical protein [Desulfarculaceae bacterium]MCF8102068.1 hypothetical protein [Desulfarculaceae bacterium]MCF8116339.1 hypothetical protein [Desulfarculaceae bacterium]